MAGIWNWPRPGPPRCFVIEDARFVTRSTPWAPRDMKAPASCLAVDLEIDSRSAPVALDLAADDARPGGGASELGADGVQIRRIVSPSPANWKRRTATLCNPEIAAFSRGLRQSPCPAKPGRQRSMFPSLAVTYTDSSPWRASLSKLAGSLISA